jgi:hypothetical protein
MEDRMAKAKIKAGRKAVKRKKTVKRKPAAAASLALAPVAPRPVLIPGAWPFPMGSKP